LHSASKIRILGGVTIPQEQDGATMRDDNGSKDDDRRAVILVVEDDVTISDLLAYNLRRAGYAVRQERSGRAGLETALAGAADLVLLDLMLPGIDGLTAGRELRRNRPELPIIILTARSERQTMLEGFDLGADDYVTKPFDMDVLLARIEARLRRVLPTPVREAGPRPTVDVKLDPDAHQLVSPHGAVTLKPKEYDLLDLLLSAPGRLFPREEIVERVWHHRYLPGSRTLDVHIRRLREKLERVEARVTISTIRGVGYRIVGDTSQAARQAGPRGRSAD
jgi:DNA-binding response OmpR family regulator